MKKQIQTIIPLKKRRSPTAMSETGDARFCVFHQNTPKIIAKLLEAIGGNVENMENKSRGDIAYTIIDATGYNPEAEETVKDIPGIIRYRVIK